MRHLASVARVASAGRGTHARAASEAASNLGRLGHPPEEDKEEEEDQYSLILDNGYTSNL